jgi:hypothetical protein
MIIQGSLLQQCVRQQTVIDSTLGYATQNAQQPCRLDTPQLKGARGKLAVRADMQRNLLLLRSAVTDALFGVQCKHVK